MTQIVDKKNVEFSRTSTNGAHCELMSNNATTPSVKVLLCDFKNLLSPQGTLTALAWKSMELNCIP